MDQRCVFEGCTRTGEPLEGYTYFACESCLDKLEEELNREYQRRLAALVIPTIVARVTIGVKL